MKRMSASAAAIFLAVVVTHGVASPVAAAQGVRAQEATVYWGSVEDGGMPGDEVEGAGAKLVRAPDSVSMRLRTNGLRPGHAYTVWWAIFNEPQNCIAVIKPPGADRCGDPDWALPLAEPSTLWAVGGVASEDGTAVFAARLEVGDSSNAAFDGDPGLTNPMGAEIQLHVRDHGPAVEGSDQTTTFNGGCVNYVPGATGGPGTYPCVNPQVATFPGE